jgi:hypothetical protein
MCSVQEQLTHAIAAAAAAAKRSQRRRIDYLGVALIERGVGTEPQARVGKARLQRR